MDRSTAPSDSPPLNAPRAPLMSLALGLLCLLASACGASSYVDGTVAGIDFSVRDNAPELRGIGDRLTVVLAEEKGDSLYLVKIRLPDLSSLKVGEITPLVDPDSDLGPSVEAVIGDLEVIERADGVRVLNAINPRYLPAIQGTFTLDSREPLAGSFQAVMADGGLLEGSFVILP